VLKAGGFEIGKKLAIAVVSEAAPGGKPILDGEITAVEAEIERDRTVTIVRGYDSTHRLQRGTTTETHLDVTYGDIVAKVAKRRGLQAGDGGTNRVVHEAVVQWNQTDWEFVARLAAEIGHEVVVVDGQLHLREPSDSASGPSAGDLQAADARKLVVGGNVLRLRAAVSGAEQVEEVQVRGWDYKEKAAVEGTAKAADGSRSSAAGTGSATLAEKLGGGTLVKVDWPVESAEVAQHAADSLVEQLGSAAVELDGVVHGNPELRAGVTISLAGAGTPFDGQYVLTSCRHTYDPTAGYLTSLRVSGRQTRTMLGIVNGTQGGDRNAVRGVVPAIVSNVDDPEQLGRMKVTSGES
jgi:phage protein D